MLLRAASANERNSCVGYFRFVPPSASWKEHHRSTTALARRFLSELSIGCLPRRPGEWALGSTVTFLNTTDCRTGRRGRASAHWVRISPQGPLLAGWGFRDSYQPAATRLLLQRPTSGLPMIRTKSRDREAVFPGRHGSHRTRDESVPDIVSVMVLARMPAVVAFVALSRSEERRVG